MTTDFVRQVLDSEDVIYFPFCDWLFPNGLKINNVFLTIGNLEIYWYGFLIALGMLLAVLYVSTRMKSFGLEPDRVIDTILAGLIGGIFGARAYYVIFKLQELYLTDEGNLDIAKVFQIRDGGLAIYGGVIGALVFGLLMAKIRKVKIAPMLDLMGLGLLIGQCLGRWGNFFNQEAYGAKTTLPWGMTSNKILNGLYFFYYPENTSIITNRATDMVAHPCFLYESLWCLCGFILLHIYSKKFRKFDGEIFLLYIGWYGLGRFWIEALRTDSLYLPGGVFKVSQVVAGTCVLFSIIFLAVRYSQVKKAGYVFYYETDESKELLRIYDEKRQDSKNRRKNANGELKEHILADEERSEGSEEEEVQTEFETLEGTDKYKAADGQVETENSVETQGAEKSDVETNDGAKEE